MGERWLRKVCLSVVQQGKGAKVKGETQHGLCWDVRTYVRTYAHTYVRTYVHSMRMKSMLYSLVFSDVHMVDNRRREGILSAPPFEG